MFNADFAQISAFYGDPLPFERSGKGYMETIIVAKIAALRACLGQAEAIRWDRPVAAKSRAKPKAVKATKRLSAEQFFDAYQVARKAVCEAIGDRWVILGHARWASLPAGWRSFTGPRGGKVRLPKDIRVPAAEYWPGGVLPDGLVLVDVETKMTPWVTHFVDGVGPVKMHPTLVRLEHAHAESIREYRDAMNGNVEMAEAAD